MLQLSVLVACSFTFNVNIYCDALKKYKPTHKWHLEMEIINVYMYFISFYTCTSMYNTYLSCFLSEYRYVMAVHWQLWYFYIPRWRHLPWNRSLFVEDWWRLSARSFRSVAVTVPGKSTQMSLFRWLQHSPGFEIYSSPLA